MAKDDLTKVYYSPWVEPPFFAKLTLNNDEVVKLEGSGELTSAMISQYKSTLVSVEIGELCTSIGHQAFSGCKGLTSVTIGSGVTEIGSAFQNCTSLTSITSLRKIEPTIDSYTFYKVKTGGTLTVPSGSTGYDLWMSTDNYYLGRYGWTKVVQ